jgi:hypothetical protein
MRLAMPERRHSLTPLQSELQPQHEAPRAPSRFERVRQRRRDRRPPTTTLGAIRRGLILLAIAAAVASGMALLVDHWTGRSTSFGFYVVGAALFAIAFFTSASSMGGRYTYYSYAQSEREGRVQRSFSYILAGAIVIAIGVVIDLISR